MEITEQEKEITSSFKEMMKKDYQKFFTDCLGVELWEKEREIVESVFNHQKTTIRSNNSSGKTYTIARIALAFLFAFPPAVVINTAPTHRQVENQFWREFRKAHKSAKIKLGGKLLKTQYNIAENWYAIGFSTQNGDEGMEKFQGWHGENILIIVDEASGVHPAIFEAISGALAGGGTVRIVYIGNPTRNTGDFAESFKDPTFNKIHISAFDIPNVKEKKVVITGLATYEWVEDMKRKYGEDSDIYRVRVLGEFPKKEADTLISIDSVDKAQNEEREKYGEEEMILLDPSRFGNDEAVFIYKKGNYAKVLEKIQKVDTMTLAGKGKIYLKQFPKARLRIDIIGLGSGVFDRLREQDDISGRVEGVNVAMPAEDKEHYGNTRAESWDLMRLWLRDAILEADEGWYELCSPKMKIKSNGQLQLESKEEMRKRGVKSPNVGDALALAFANVSEGAEFIMGVV